MGQKQKNCDPANPDDDHQGDSWDHVAFDPEHKLVLAVIPGARTEENARALVAEVDQRTDGDQPPLLTSDEYPAYTTAIEETFSEPVPAPGRAGPGRPRVVPERQMSEEVIYATVHQHREDNRVVAVEARQIFGTPEDLEDLLDASEASHRVNSRSWSGRTGPTGAATPARRTGSARTGRFMRR